MNSESSQPDDSSAPAGEAARKTGFAPRKFRLSRLALKELRETLRDRRTIVTLILMPLLVYPVLSLVFKTFLLSNVGLLGSDEPVVLQIAYSGDENQKLLDDMLGKIVRGVDTIESENDVRSGKAEGSEKASKIALNDGQVVPLDPDPNLRTWGDLNPAPDESAADESLDDPIGVVPRKKLFAPFVKHQWFYLAPESPEGVKQVVESGKADVGVLFEVADRKNWQVGKIKLVSRSDALSNAATEYLFSNFEALNEFDVKQRLIQNNLPSGPALSLSEEVVGPEETAGSQPVPIASLVPLILVLMTITGAVYPAIDLTAGERERGTLETLMAAPIPRVGILFSKFLAVLTVAVLTAVLNLIGMFATVWAFQLDKQLGGGVFTVTVMFQIFLLLILFAAFFSAILLAVTSFAKSFKEAQVYLIPIILLSLGPGLMAMAPGMSLDGVNSVVPMVNILLLARDVIQTEVMLVPAMIAVASTMLYTYLAIRMAAYIFGSDSILYSAGGSFGEMFQRPMRSSRVVPIMATVFCLVMLFPINFASIGYLGRMPADTTTQLSVRFLTMGLFTFLAFMVLPWLVARHQNTDIKAGFGLNSPRVVFLLAALLLGISLWPLVMYLTTVWHDIYGAVFGSEKQAEWAKRLVETTSQQVERIRQLPEWVILISLSIIPAVCEEWFFRGMLLRSLLKFNTAWKAILISAAVFGSFHVLSNSVIAIDRLIPTTLIGIVLGYLAYKSNSIFPGIILHALNNGIVVFLAYFQPQLTKEYAWFPGDQDSIPVSWVLVGAAVAAIGLSLVWFSRPDEADVRESELDATPKPLVEAG